MELDGFREDALLTGISTFVGYGILIVGMFLILFVLPYLVFLALG